MFDMRFHGIERFSLVDYDGYTACTLFTGGCNYRCPFCQNAALVLAPESEPTVDNADIEEYLRRRVGILDAVCITGGEPTLYPELPDFIAFVKSLGYKVKLDTNGTSPKMLKELISSGLLDYVAMDIKNSPDMYPLTTGVCDAHIDKVIESTRLLKDAYKARAVDIEFRTTLVKGHHTEDDMLIIGKWLEGAPRYFLQKFEDKRNCISSAPLAPIEKEQAEAFAQILREFIPAVKLRGYSD